MKTSGLYNAGLKISTFDSRKESDGNGAQQYYTPMQSRYRLNSMDQKDTNESKLDQRNKYQKHIRNISLYDTNMSHSLQVMEKILQSKHKEQLQRSYAIGGSAAMSPNSKGEKSAKIDFNSYQKEIDGPVSPRGESDMSKYYKNIKDSRIVQGGKNSFCRPNIR
ncbi:UNKNOWN [Stylonychia lemnae]|uniref:Uncharacterized protein n=1 Tax=Stylonychia lemnae TaxID=5949 RepID=A0A077ZVZ7_STYLE|nr:UNKNOWN [Stylonychia lemnae]|eukprot:CDW74049.1 UNKNOWN [Stylonychia lemnae]